MTWPSTRKILAVGIGLGGSGVLMYLAILDRRGAMEALISLVSGITVYYFTKPEG